MNTADIMALLTEFRAATDFYNQEDRNWKSLLCNVTTAEYVRRPQRSVGMREVGEGGIPVRQRMDYQTIHLPEPGRWGVGSAVTQKAIEDGIDEEQLRANHAECLAADYRLITKLCIRAMLTDGGWWDGTAQPPAWAMNTFTATHTHYLVDATTTTPTLSNWTALQRHIQEHGFGLENAGGVIAVINGAMAKRIVDTAEYVQDVAPMNTKAMETLQWLGLTADFRAGGVYVTTSDWVPDKYIMAWAAGEKPLHWRLPLGMEGRDELLMWESPENVQIKGAFDYIRRGSAKVTLRGAGAAYYLPGAGDGSWVDPDIDVTD